ncbi:MAG TPA: cytochrome c biogenesis protein ResB [Burkholderiaceae bacterium]
MSEQSIVTPPVPDNSLGRELIDLLSSMRFAISVFVVIIIASITGTVVKQGEPLTNYVNQFGPFWAEVLGHVGLFSVYSAWWFLLMLAFLVTSTSLCIARNAPKIVADLKSLKENLREQSLQAFHHKALGELPLNAETAVAEVSALLTQEGWKLKQQVRDRGTMLAARRGGANKIGYLCAHSAIVLICLGGLSDGDMVVRALMWAQGKTVYTGGGLIRDVSQEHRLGVGNPTYRGNLSVSEGGRAATAVIAMTDGVVLQELPFDVELKQFKVDFYSTGMPKLFSSDVVIHDHETGATQAATIKVNEPLTYRGTTLFQSSFEDGGSQLKLRALPLSGQGDAFTIEGVVGGSTTLDGGDKQLTLEFSGLRVINVENLGGDKPSGADVRGVDLVSRLDKHLGSGAKKGDDKTLRNVGPSVSYKLRDAAGQAREYNNYMLPVDLDGQRVFLAGVRDTPADAFRYLRIPADVNDSIDTWWRIRHALLDPQARELAADRFANVAVPASQPQTRPQLLATARKTLAMFAGVEGIKPGVPPRADLNGGLPALSAFIESEVPAAERARVSDVLLRILNGALFELYKISQERAGAPEPTTDATTQAFMTQTVLGLSDSLYYPAPVLLTLDEFKQVQASVFQVARAPGQKLVYLGAILLIIGVFCMLYVRERRLWIWFEPRATDSTRVRMALSCTRVTLDTDDEFARLRSLILKDERP